MSDTRGFSVVEVGVATVILTVALLGLAASTGQMLTAANDEEVAAVAVGAVEDRLAQIRSDQRYEELGVLYGGSERPIEGLDGVMLSTLLERTHRAAAGGDLDHWVVVVTAAGGSLRTPIRGTAVIASP